MEIVNKKISELKAAEYNPRKISVEQLKHLKKSLEKFDCIEPAVININSDRKNTIIGGHQRIKAAKSLGWKEFPCIEVNFSLEQEREANIRLNKNTGEFDFELLESEFEFDDLIEYGFSEEELNFMQIEEIGEVEGEDDVPEVVKDQIVKKGDIWILGDHRLLCGDATIVSDVDKLMDGKKADMVFTDPPYGISIVSKNGSVGKTKGKYSPVKGDETKDVAVDSFNLCQSLNIPIQFFWGANHYSSNLPDSTCWVVWDKQGGKSVTFADCELCYTNIKAPVRMFTHIWDGFRRDSERGEMRVHPTQKPVQLFIDIWKKFDCPYIVLDLFGGSGSTLIACEKTKRKCFMMEIEEKYCDIIITRWQNFTGNSAILEATGEVYG